MYVDKLNDYGINTSIIGELPQDKKLSDLKILFLGSSYFIDNKFEFEIGD